MNTNVSDSYVYRLEQVYLVILSILGVYFCLDFGYLLTNWDKGSLLGIPVTFTLSILSTITIFTKGKKKRIFRFLTAGYLATLLVIILIVLRIKQNGKTGFSYLYDYERGALDLFLQTLFIGFLVTILCVFWRENKK